MNKTADEFITEINALTAELDEYYTRINAGEELDLDGLDGRVDLLTAQIAEAPPEVATQIQKPVAEMISSLERLASLLQDITSEDE